MNKMNIIDILRDLTKPLHKEIYDSQEQIYDELEKIEKSISVLEKQYDEQLLVNMDLIKKLADKGKNQLELYCKENYTQIDNIAYQNKRSHQNQAISVFLNQMITPDVFEVQRIRQKLNLKGDLMQQIITAGNWQARNFTWTDDKNLANSGDYYLYPEEIIVTDKGDCEDHAYCLASILPEIGVAYGFYDDETQRYGHAWNIALIDGKLFHIETTGSKVKLHDFTSDNPYETHYIITQSCTFELNGTVKFGTIANW